MPMKKIAIVTAATLMLAGVSFTAIADQGTKSVTGTPEDSFCWAAMGAHGASHQKCATACAKKGIPVSLVEKGTDKVYVLIPPKNDQPLPDDLVNKMENEVTVTGKEFTKGGVNYLTVESVK
jgi:hypothetical protein